MLNSKTAFLFILLAMLPLLAFAQYFSKSIDLDQSGDSGWNIFTLDEELLIFVASTYHGASATALVKTDFEGHVLSTKIFEGAKAPTPNAILLEDTSILLLTRPIPALPNRIQVARLNLEGEVLQEWAFGEELEYEIPFGITPFGDEYVIFGALLPPGQAPSTGFQLYFNQQFELQNSLFFEENAPLGIVAETDLIPTQGARLLGANVDGFVGEVEGILTMLDSSGQVVWQRRLPIVDPESNFLSVLELDNGNLAAGWFYELEAVEYPLLDFGTVIYGLSPGGDSLWAQYYLTFETDLKTVLELDKAANGDIIGSGYAWKEIEEDLPPAYIGWIFRLSPQGEPVWDRYIYDARSPERYAYLFNATELPNGDLAFTGSYYDTLIVDGSPAPDPNIWLVRVDSNGCLTPGCADLQVVTDTGIVQVTATNDRPREEAGPGPFRLFPNPAGSEVFLAAPAQATQPLEHLELRLFSALGQQVLERRWRQWLPGRQEAIDVSRLPPGLYTWVLSTSGGWLQSAKLVIR
ncbi:MAG: T9SS type A sorting domain-containing protein [Lewinellaceae bacterium]|nr:T9SS type A sorting domain-containing protein [Lewinellaceae bacterium]